MPVCNALIHVHTSDVSVLCAVTVFGSEVGVWAVMAVVSFPISFLKQCVSVVQLVVACQNIGALDSIQRARKATDTH